MSTQNKEEMQKAMEDICLIKEIMDRTSLSLINLSCTFIQLGLIILGVCVLFIISNYVTISGINIMNSNIIVTILQIMISIFITILPIIAITTIIKKVIEKNALKGVSKQLMTLWIYIVVQNVFIDLLPILGSIIIFLNPSINIPDNIPIMSIQLFICATGILCISIFSSFKFPLILAIIYMFLGFCFFFVKIHYIAILLLLPVTMIVIGVYLRIMKTRVK